MGREKQTDAKVQGSWFGRFCNCCPEASKRGLHLPQALRPPSLQPLWRPAHGLWGALWTSPPSCLLPG